MEGSLIHWRNSHEWVNEEDLRTRYRHRWATATLECSARAVMARPRNLRFAWTRGSETGLRAARYLSE